MQTNRIEIEGSNGNVTIARRFGGSATILVSATAYKPKPNQHACRVWEFEPNIGDDELFKIARDVQNICDGAVGTNSDIHGYYRDLQRFQY